MNNKLKTTSIDRFNDVDKHIKIIHQILISTICMGVLAVIVYKTNIPNPNMIMVTGLVIFSALFGTNGGIPAAIIMMVYTTFFFSENHSFVTYTDLNLRKVYVTLFVLHQLCSYLRLVIFFSLFKQYSPIWNI